MFFALIAISFLAISCNNDDDNTPTNANLTLNLDGLDDLGNDFVYEGWIIVDGAPVSTGVFTSVTFPQTFSVNAIKLEEATKFVLTIEPTGRRRSFSFSNKNSSWRFFWKYCKCKF